MIVNRRTTVFVTLAQGKPCSSSSLAELPRFENSRNVEMRSTGLGNPSPTVADQSEVLTKLR